MPLEDPSSSTAADDARSIASISTTSSSSSQHKRSLSASLLARVPFLRPAQNSRDNGTLPPIANGYSYNGQQENDLRKDNGAGLATSAALPKKGRSRTSSLRKTALLGGRTLRLDKRSPGLETIVSPRLDNRYRVGNDGEAGVQLSPDSDDSATPRASYDSGNDVYLVTHAKSESLSSEENLPLSAAALQARRETTRASELSTTDEEDLLNAPRTAVTSNGNPGIKQITDESYFDLDPGGVRRRPSKKPRSPLATIPVENMGTAEVWDYAETEWWGWVILIVTWIVFVVGMGSCFEVWSWAWDVGQTPYAPPELEDDPTLPIVGYYPALIILTGVMSWVWVIIAWVGMKYFRHAKIPGEDG